MHSAKGGNESGCGSRACLILQESLRSQEFRRDLGRIAALEVDLGVKSTHRFPADLTGKAIERVAESR